MNTDHIMVRSLLFLDQFGYLGGAQRILWEILKSLDPTEYDCRVAINGPGEFRDSLVKARVPVLDLPLGNYHSNHKTVADVARLGVRSLTCTAGLVLQGRRKPWDLLWANGPRTFATAVLAGLITGTPVVWHLHKISSSKSEIKGLLILSRWVQRIIACSDAAAAPLLASRHKLESKIRILYNPHPDWDWAPLAKQSSSLRKEFGLAGEDYLFGILGRVTPFKGQKEFLHAAARVIRLFPRAWFFVIGSPAPGDSTDLEYQAELRQLVGNSSLDHHVFFLPHQCGIQELMESLDAVVMASIGPEALPQSLIEAMFLAKPVIAPALGGILEMINDPISGLLYKAGDEEALAGKMQDLVRSRQLGMQLGSNARETVLEKFSRVKFQDGIREEIAGCLGGAE